MVNRESNGQRVWVEDAASGAEGAWHPHTDKPSARLTAHIMAG